MNEKNGKIEDILVFLFLFLFFVFSWRGGKFERWNFFFGLVEKKKKNEKIENRVCINLPIYLDTQFFFLKARINYSFLIIKNTHVQVKKKVIHLTQKKKKRKRKTTQHYFLTKNKLRSQKTQSRTTISRLVLLKVFLSLPVLFYLSSLKSSNQTYP